MNLRPQPVAAIFISRHFAILFRNQRSIKAAATTFGSRPQCASELWRWLLPMNLGLQPRRVGRGVLTAPNFPDSESCLHGALGQPALPYLVGSWPQCASCIRRSGLPMNRGQLRDQRSGIMKNTSENEPGTLSVTLFKEERLGTRY